MRRPRIALWIKWHARGWVAVRNESPIWWCPNWLWRWAMRRVDRWRLMTATLPQWHPPGAPGPDATKEQIKEWIRIVEEHAKL